MKKLLILSISILLFSCSERLSDSSVDLDKEQKIKILEVNKALSAGIRPGLHGPRTLKSRKRYTYQLVVDPTFKRNHPGGSYYIAIQERSSSAWTSWRNLALYKNLTRSISGLTFPKINKTKEYKIVYGYTSQDGNRTWSRRLIVTVD